MHILLAVAKNGKCRICKQGGLINPTPTMLNHAVNQCCDNKREIYASFVYESWCDDDGVCGAYHLTFSNELGTIEQQACPADSWKNLHSEVDKRLHIGIVESSKHKPTRERIASYTQQEILEMPEIIQDFDPKIRRSGSGSGRPQIFHIDLKPLDQVAGKTQGDNKTPVFVKYTLEDLDGASDATFQQQVRNYADSMDKGNTKHGYRAQVRTIPLMDDNGPVTDENGKQVNDFYVAVVPVTDKDIQRRESYQKARSNGKGKEGNKGSAEAKEADTAADAKASKETAKAK